MTTKIFCLLYDQYDDKQIPDFNRRFSLSFDYHQISDGAYNITRRIPFERCSEEVLKLRDGYFSAISKENYYCFPKGNNWPITGIDNQGNFTRIRIQLESCKNNTDPIKVHWGPIVFPKSILSK